MHKHEDEIQNVSQRICVHITCVIRTRYVNIASNLFALKYGYSFVNGNMYFYYLTILIVYCVFLFIILNFCFIFFFSHYFWEIHWKPLQNFPSRKNYVCVLYVALILEWFNLHTNLHFVLVFFFSIWFGFMSAQ